MDLELVRVTDRADQIKRILYEVWTKVLRLEIWQNEEGRDIDRLGNDIWNSTERMNE